MRDTWEQAESAARALGVKVIYAPDLWPMSGITLRKRVIVKYRSARLLRHELVHVRQQMAEPVKFWLRYATRAGRFALELEAYKESVRWGLPPEVAAGHLSGALYLWPCSYTDALRALTEE